MSVEIKEVRDPVGGEGSPTKDEITGNSVALGRRDSPSYKAGLGNDGPDTRDTGRDKCVSPADRKVP